MDEQTTIGKNFGGAVRYLFAGRRDQPSDKQAELLASKGVNTNSVAEMIADFELGRDLNPRLNLAVWHTSLSFNPDDEARMSNARMRAIAEDYLKKMGLDNTQYIVVRHRDRPDHHHLHIVANRVDNAGKSVADVRNFFHSNLALKELIKDHGLTPPQGPRPALQHPERFRPTDLARHNLRATLNPAVLRETQWPQLLATLKEEGIASKLYYNQAGKATGISFEKDGYCFKGSALGPHLSLAGIDKQLAANELRQRVGAVVPAVAVAPASRPLEAPVTTLETPSAFLAKAESVPAPGEPAPVGTAVPNVAATALSGSAASGPAGIVRPEATAKKEGNSVLPEQPIIPVPTPGQPLSLPLAVGPVASGEAVRPLPVGPCQDATEPVAGKGMSALAPTGADKPVAAAPTELPAPQTVGPNENLPLAGGLTAAVGANQSTPVMPTAPVALPAMSLAEMLISAVPDLPSAPAVAAPELPAALSPTQSDSATPLQGHLPVVSHQIAVTLAEGNIEPAMVPAEASKKQPNLQPQVFEAETAPPPAVVAVGLPVDLKEATEPTAGRSPLGRVVLADPPADVASVKAVAQQLRPTEEGGQRAEAIQIEAQRRENAAIAAFQQAHQQVAEYRTQTDTAKKGGDYALVGILRGNLQIAEGHVQRCETELRKTLSVADYLVQMEAQKKVQQEQAHAKHEREQLADLESFRRRWPYSGTHIRLQVPVEYLPTVSGAIRRHNYTEYELQEHADKTTSPRVVDGKVAVNILYETKENAAKLDDALREFRKNGVEVFEQPADRTSREERAADTRLFERQYAEKLSRSNAFPEIERGSLRQIEM